MPLVPTSADSDLVRPIIPAFEAAYAVDPLPPLTPRSEEMLMIHPIALQYDHLEKIFDLFIPSRRLIMPFTRS